MSIAFSLQARGETAQGERVEAVAFTRDQLKVRTPRAFAPGAPVILAEVYGERRVEGKSIGCRKVASSDETPLYELRVRATNLRKELRAWLAETLPSE